MGRLWFGPPPSFSETRLVVIEMQVSYRLTTPTLGMIESENGDRTLVTIPQRAVITVVDGLLDGDRMFKRDVAR
jgi:hypothetical protein